MPEQGQGRAEEERDAGDSSLADISMDEGGWETGIDIFPPDPDRASASDSGLAPLVLPSRAAEMAHESLQRSEGEINEIPAPIDGWEEPGRLEELEQDPGAAVSKDSMQVVQAAVEEQPESRIAPGGNVIMGFSGIEGVQSSRSEAESEPLEGEEGISLLHSCWAGLMKRQLASDMGNSVLNSIDAAMEPLITTQECNELVDAAKQKGKDITLDLLQNNLLVSNV